MTVDRLAWRTRRNRRAKPHRVLVTGSRDWQDPIRIGDALIDQLPTDGTPMTVVCGDCPTGADATTRTWVQWVQSRTRSPVTCETHHADWHLHGKAAGPIRNQKMIDSGADICLSFIRGGSPGATDCTRRAEAAGITTIRFTAGWVGTAFGCRSGQDDPDIRTDEDQP